MASCMEPWGRWKQALGATQFAHCQADCQAGRVVLGHCSLALPLSPMYVRDLRREFHLGSCFLSLSYVFLKIL